jgi:hypothetical protein
MFFGNLHKLKTNTDEKVIIKIGITKEDKNKK